MTIKQMTFFTITGLILIGVTVFISDIENYFGAANENVAGSNHTVRSVGNITREDLEMIKNDIIELKQHKQDLRELSVTMTRELASIQSKLADLSSAEQKGMESVTFADDAPEAGWEKQTDDPELAAQEVQQKIDDFSEKQVTLMEDTARGESADPTWAPKAQQSLQAAIQSTEVKGFYFEGADCRTTLCRVDLSFDGDITPDEGFRSIVNAIPWESAGFSIIDDETGEVHIYLAREGYDLPKADISARELTMTQ